MSASETFEADLRTIWGQAIRNRREGLNKTQTSLARELGVSVQAVSQWEKGESFPGHVLKFKIADALRIEHDVLFQRGSAT